MPGGFDADCESHNGTGEQQVKHSLLFGSWQRGGQATGVSSRRWAQVRAATVEPSSGASRGEQEGAPPGQRGAEPARAGWATGGVRKDPASPAGEQGAVGAEEGGQRGGRGGQPGGRVGGAVPAWREGQVNLGTVNPRVDPWLRVTGSGGHWAVVPVEEDPRGVAWKGVSCPHRPCPSACGLQGVSSLPLPRAPWPGRQPRSRRWTGISEA